MYRKPHVICVAALVCQSGPALAIREPGSACGIRVGQNQFPPLQALWNGESGWRRNALNPASGAYRVRYGNSRVKFATTPNHRWLMSEDTNPNAAKGFTRIQDRGKRDVLILAKEHHADDGLPITLEEAALLGWIAGDGWEEKARVSKATGRNAYCPHCGRGQKNRFRPATYFVSQTKRKTGRPSRLLSTATGP
jgi:hypothetical protein